MFKFELKDAVVIDVSGEAGTVEGRAEYANGAPPSYFVRYKSADGRAVEGWWEEVALRAP